MFLTERYVYSLQTNASDSDGGRSVDDGASQGCPKFGKGRANEDEEAKTKRVLLHTRHRDESPASKKVSLYPTCAFMDLSDITVNSH